MDALATLRKFYDWERATKTQVLRAERRLLALFDGEAPGGGGGPGLEVSGRPGRGSQRVGTVPTRALGPYVSNHTSRLCI